MSRQTDKEEREAAEREAEEKAKAKEEAKAKAKAEKEQKPDLGRNDDIESAQKPYPHGSPPDPEDEFEKIHGFRRVKP